MRAICPICPKTWRVYRVNLAAQAAQAGQLHILKYLQSEPAPSVWDMTVPRDSVQHLVLPKVAAFNGCAWGPLHLLQQHPGRCRATPWPACPEVVPGKHKASRKCLEFSYCRKGRGNWRSANASLAPGTGSTCAMDHGGLQGSRKAWRHQHAEVAQESGSPLPMERGCHCSSCRPRHANLAMASGTEPSLPLGPERLRNSSPDWSHGSPDLAEGSETSVPLGLGLLYWCGCRVPC